MPQINCETDLDDVSKIGMLSLNSDTEEQIYAHIRAGFNALMQRSNDIAENSDTFNQTAEQLHSLLDNLTKAPSSSDTTNILTKCLEFIKSHNLFLTQGDIANQLVELLHVNDDDECNKDICQILIESVQPLSEKQEKDLNDLLVRSSTEHLLNLLIEKEILSIGAVETIILSIKVTANDEENNNLHANQLIILAKSFDKYPKLKQKFQGPILDFFKEYDDSEFLAQIFRSVGDKSFFDPINQELQKKFNELSVLLEIERAVNTIRLEKNTSEEIKQKLTELTNKDDVLISQNSYQLLSSLGIILENIDGRYIVLKNNDWLKEIRNLGKDFNKFLQYQEEINPNIVFDYESYLAEILTLEYKLPESIYKNILQSNTYICWKLLGGQNNLSESSTRLLISSLDKYQGGTVDHIQNVSFTIAKLVDKKQLPEESTEQAIKLLTTYIGTPDKHIAENIVYCFRHFASDNIENNSFTEGVYQQYLGSNLEDTTILQGLEYIIDNKGELPTSCISNLVEFSLNDEVNDQDRCYGLKLIGKVINQVTQGDIVKVSKLFNCVNELPDTEYDLQDTLDIGYLVTLEEIQLDKYLAEQGLKVQDTYSTIESIGESYGIFSNRFFESISVQLAGLGQVKSPEEIYQMTMESLRLAAGDSAARPIIPLQEYYTSISGNLLSRETIQAAANVLGVNISIYNYDASIREITSCGEARGERVKIGATNNNYFSLVRDNTNYSVATTDQITISSGESYDEVVPVSAVILKNSIRLLESYAKEYNMLPAESLSSLKLLMDNPLLREDIVNILSYLISVSPDQLDAEILDFITSNEPNLDQIVKFNRSISSIKELLNHPSVESSADQEDENTKSITLELEKILTILEGNSENIISLSQLKELYNLFELILKKEPESFTVILSIIEYC
ncbi:MAG TPA: hypothetical protein DCG18_06390, partial [Richelia sp.]|nr:hypothetical protein [Richelia sp.]